MRRIIVSLMCVLAMVFAFGCYANADLSDGLVAYYPFDGDATDSSENGHDGTVYGATLVIDKNGQADSAYSFDGVNDYIKIPNHADLNFDANFSIAFWVNGGTKSGTRVLLSKGADCGNSYFFGWSGAGRFNLSYGAKWCGMTPIGASVPNEEWHHVVVTIDNINHKMYYYLDGVLSQEKDIDYFATNNSFPLVLGRHFACANGGCSYTYHWEGELDELRLYDRSLSLEDVQEIYNFGIPQINLVYPKLPSSQRAGDEVLIVWDTENIDSSDEIMISMKRLSVPSTQTEPDDCNWYIFTLIDNTNNGYEVVTIPAGIEEGNDWHFYVKHVASGKWDSTDTPFEVSESKRNWGVPFLSQKDYPNNMKESACGPTSVAMLLQYYYPNSQIDMPEVYHAGTQTYKYDSGPAYAYRNLSFMVLYGDTGYSELSDPVYENYYWGEQQADLSIDYSKKANYSGTTLGYMNNYLYNIWGIQNAGTALGENDVYEKIEEGPLLCRVYAHGNTNWGHFVVIIGIDQGADPTDRTDDSIYIHDPYDVWNSTWDNGGENKEIPYDEFFVSGAYFGGAWFRYAYQLSSQDSDIERLYSVIVDTGHNDFEGYANPHVFTLFNEEAETATGDALWKFYYGAGGDWYYPEESGQSARWTPELPINGYYRVEVRYRADNQSGTVTYTAHFYEDISTNINQNNVTDEWRTSVVVDSMYLGAGCYVKATSIPAGTNIDAVKFTFLHE